MCVESKLNSRLFNCTWEMNLKPLDFNGSSCKKDIPPSCIKSSLNNQGNNCELTCPIIVEVIV